MTVRVKEYTYEVYALVPSSGVANNRRVGVNIRRCESAKSLALSTDVRTDGHAGESRSIGLCGKPLPPSKPRPLLGAPDAGVMARVGRPCSSNSGKCVEPGGAKMQSTLSVGCKTDLASWLCQTYRCPEAVGADTNKTRRAFTNQRSPVSDILQDTTCGDSPLNVGRQRVRTTNIPSWTECRSK